MRCPGISLLSAQPGRGRRGACAGEAGRTRKDGLGPLAGSPAPALRAFQSTNRTAFSDPTSFMSLALSFPTQRTFSKKASLL